MLYKWDFYFCVFYTSRGKMSEGKKEGRYYTLGTISSAAGQALAEKNQHSEYIPLIVSLDRPNAKIW